MSSAAVADRWGRKRMLLGYTLVGVASLMLMLTDAAQGIIAIRALLRLSKAMIMPTALLQIRLVFTAFSVIAALTLLAQWLQLVHGASLFTRPACC
ncbi:hypothetical protein [Streptomyces radiopugnans]|uniref:hypothetical protein n=1 Tax=Streptomyces radiopugnans TaxID=403935 RepID=UPI003F1E06CA